MEGRMVEEMVEEVGGGGDGEWGVAGQRKGKGCCHLLAGNERKEEE